MRHAGQPEIGAMPTDEKGKPIVDLALVVISAWGYTVDDSFDELAVKECFDRFPLPTSLLPLFCSPKELIIFESEWGTALLLHCVAERQKQLGVPPQTAIHEGTATLTAGIMTHSGRNELTEEGRDLIRQAGEMLNEAGGFDTMYMVFRSHVPSGMSLRQLVNELWDGIGEWKC